MPVNSWDLQIPVKLTLASNEISSPDRVLPVYLLASRQGYLQSLTQQAHRFFQHALLQLPGQSRGSSWCDHQGLPLLWRLPTGVLVDLLLGPHPTLPWSLVLHYQDPPSSNTTSSSSGTPAAAGATAAGAVGLHNQLDVRGELLNSLKEAAYICRGGEGAKAIMNMGVAAQDGLWAAVEAGDGPAFRYQLAQLKLMPTQRQAGGPFIPVRVILRDSEGPIKDLAADTHSTTRPVPALQPDGQYTHLGHLLLLVAPHLPAVVAVCADLPSSRPPAAAAPTAAAGEPGGVTPSAGGAADTSSSGQQPEGPAAAHATNAAAASQSGVPSQEQQQQGQEEGLQPRHSSDAAAGPEPPAGTGAVPSSTSPSDPLQAEAGEGDKTAVRSARDSCVNDSGQQPSTLQQQAGDAELARASTASPAKAAAGGASDVSKVPKQPETTTAAPLPPPPPPAAAAAAAVTPEHPGLVVLVCGVQPPLHTPLAWLHAQLHAPDYFLYVVVHASSRS